MADRRHPADQLVRNVAGGGATRPRTNVSYTFFTEQLTAENVQTVTSTADTMQGEFTKEVGYPPRSKEAEQVGLFTTQRPSFATDDLLATLEAKDVTVNANSPDAPPSLWRQVLLGFGPTLLLVGLLLWVARRGAASLGGGGLGQVREIEGDALQGGRRHADDVRGRRGHRRGRARGAGDRRLPGASRSATRRLGARIPARRAACPARPARARRCSRGPWRARRGVPFFSHLAPRSSSRRSWGSAPAGCATCSRRRRRSAPAIIFIDELDAIGRARGGVASTRAGDDEREQTLNQILTEMDGFHGQRGRGRPGGHQPPGGAGPGAAAARAASTAG